MQSEDLSQRARRVLLPEWVTMHDIPVVPHGMRLSCREHLLHNLETLLIRLQLSHSRYAPPFRQRKLPDTNDIDDRVPAGAVATTTPNTVLHEPWVERLSLTYASNRTRSGST